MTGAKTTQDGQAKALIEAELLSFAEFLETVPPSQQMPVADLCQRKMSSAGAYYVELETPELQLHCTNDTCNGLRFFRYSSGDKLLRKGSSYTYLTYICSNCRKTHKVFSIYALAADEEGGAGNCYKFGEVPVYGPPTPARLIRLFGKERENFLKGRRCENQGLGIGAFVYYRRVVENQKNAILDEIIRVSEKIGAPADMLERLRKAKDEIQFSKALASVKDALPQALLINGHNPLAMLHSALSGGLHEKTDERCLELAHDIRVLLVELAERIGQALKDEAELNTAVSRLMSIDRMN